MCVACCGWLGWQSQTRSAGWQGGYKVSYIVSFETNVDALRLAVEVLNDRNPETSSTEDVLLRRAISLIIDEIEFWSTCPPEINA